MKPQNKEDRITQIMNDPKKMQLILQAAVNDALLKHKQAGNSVCGFKDGKVFWVEAKNILVNMKILRVNTTWVIKILTWNQCRKAALLTPVIAVVVAIIAFLQWKTNDLIRR